MGMIEDLREFAIENSLTSYELANLLGVSIDDVAAWFDADKSPESDERYRILKLMEGQDNILNMRKYSDDDLN